MIDTYLYKSYELEENKWLKRIQIGGFWTFFVAGILTAFLTILCLLWLSGSAMDSVSTNEKYSDYDYQEYLIAHPEYKFKANNKTITKFKRPDLILPMIVELDMGNNNIYEVFIKESGKEIPIIVKKLYVKAGGS